VYSWLGRAPVADRRVQQPGRAVGTAHRDRNAVVEVQPAERGRQAHRHRRRWRGIHRRAGGRARRTGHQPGDRLLTSRSMSGAVLRAGHASMVADNQSRPAGSTRRLPSDRRCPASARQASAVTRQPQGGVLHGRNHDGGALPGALALAYKCARPPWMAHLVSPGAAGSLHWLPFVVIAMHRQGSGSAGEDAICSSIRSDHAVISAS
jgi:hypothetical protein